MFKPKPGLTPQGGHESPRQQSANEASTRVPRVLKAHMGPETAQPTKRNKRNRWRRQSWSADLGLQRDVLKRAARTCISETSDSTRASPESAQPTDAGRTRPLPTPQSFKIAEEAERMKKKRERREEILKN
uniref:Uncharacterized protein n=1 Tax=Cebus imitator TaxID=2715852 RepID=A0A2K5S0L3_CEBIM